MAHLWIVEAKGSSRKWSPALRFQGLPGSGVHTSRWGARLAAGSMQALNQYNRGATIVVHYRVRKYIRVEEGRLPVLDEKWLPPHLQKHSVMKGLPRRTVKLYGG